MYRKNEQRTNERRTDYAEIVKKCTSEGNKKQNAKKVVVVYLDRHFRG